MKMDTLNGHSVVKNHSIKAQQNRITELLTDSQDTIP